MGTASALQLYAVQHPGDRSQGRCVCRNLGECHMGSTSPGDRLHVHSCQGWLCIADLCSSFFTCLIFHQVFRDSGSGPTLDATVSVQNTSHVFEGLDVSTSYTFAVSVVMTTNNQPPVETDPTASCVNRTSLNGTWVNGTWTLGSWANGTFAKSPMQNAVCNGTWVNSTCVNGTLANITFCDDSNKSEQTRRLWETSNSAAERLWRQQAFARRLSVQTEGLVSSGVSVLTAATDDDVVLPGLAGTVTTGTYENSKTTQLIVQPGTTGTWKGVKLTFQHFDIECSFDSVQVIEDTGLETVRWVLLCGM